MRRLSAGDRFVRSGLWPVKEYHPLAYKVGGKRVGIVGLGSIGFEVARRLVAFGCSISYNSRNKKHSVPYTYYSNLLDLAANTDVLVICCALTNETHHLINRDVMRALGKEGIVINIARGEVIDEKEMVEMLVQGELGGVGLDVFENKPHVPKELVDMDNVVLSPHSAVITPEAFQAVLGVVAANLKAFFSNKPLISPIQS